MNNESRASYFEDWDIMTVDANMEINRQFYCSDKCSKCSRNPSYCACEWNPNYHVSYYDRSPINEIITNLSLCKSCLRMVVEQFETLKCKECHIVCGYQDSFDFNYCCESEEHKDFFQKQLADYSHDD